MKRTHIQQMSMEIAVGAFIVFMVVSLGFVTIVLGKGILAPRHHVSVRFDDISGLIKGDKVYLHGVDVGRVSNMKATPEEVVLDLVLYQKLDFHEGYRISIEPTSMLGGRFVAVDAGDLGKALVPEGTVLEGAPPVDFIAEASAAVRAIRQALEKGGVLANLEVTMANIRQISDDLAAGKGTVGRLLKDESLYTNITEVAANLKTISARLEAGEGALGKLLREDELYDQLKGIAGDLKGISERLAAGKGSLGRLLSEDDTLYKDLSEAALSFKDMSASLKNIATTVEKGEGTVGKLVKDQKLYDDLIATLNEVRAMIDDIRETSPVVSFSSVFFGAL
jgi:phospholipid/cholesterol/gamma-HCH transport system substrate-binding protein